MRATLVLVVATACGRVGFSPIGLDDAASTSGDGSSFDGALDLCAAGDNVCRVSCLGVDPDCVTTCGDGRCIGNAGELCPNCAECNTQSIVCGNGACEASEDSDICFADCGPSPWLWDAVETDLLTMINNTRTGGYTCPGGGPTTAPPVVRTSTLDRGAREWAWEYGYQQFSGVACNGRTLSQRLLALGVSAPSVAWSNVTATGTPQTAMANWLGDMTICADIMSSAYTQLGIGGVYDAKHAFLVVFD